MEENKVNFHKEEISELIEGLTPFPENIFVEEQNWVNNYLLPLISIDLGILNDKLKGTIVHMINPVEPYEGLIGEGTTEFHNEFCSENWIALELTTDNKYRFLGIEDYFLSSPNHKNTDEDLIENINEIKETYHKAKERFKTSGKLLPWQEDNPQDFMDSLGGRAWEGNWTNTAPIPSAFEMIEPNEEEQELIEAYYELKGIKERLSDKDFLERVSGRVIEKEKQREVDINAQIVILKETLSKKGDYIDELTLKYKGEKFIFIGDVAGYNYCGSGADAILMFYEPKNRIVLFSYDWT